ncbi:hypothetical protein CDL15_Pgr024710 [Punica granatum]|uniref:Protein arginine methyltransferase NDUFAF7 n=1 Tax=Punica granatum TaxID=22663 RepID=A0A218W4C3_PUNGR|nr:hypothetical protein CDL15_Pgr024710 [Punica granatum]
MAPSMAFSRCLTKQQLPLLFRSSKVSPSQSLAPPLHALFSTQIVRDFIHSALYDPRHGYFSQQSGAVGVLERSIKFNQLEGRKAYMKHLDDIYKQSDISWFTPVELFKPWYAHGIAEAIMRTTNLSVPLKIYEIGGGSGTCAKGILDYIKLNAPERVYNSMTYTSVEISPSLAKIQRETVGQVSSHLSRFRVECRDAASGWGGVEQHPCWVIMLEVLDNLPHDLVYAESQVSPWMEVWVEKQHNKETLSELYKPLQDPLIKRCLEIVNLDKEQTSSTAKRLWSKKLLEILHGALPKMSLIISDFSYLPDVKIAGDRAPLVSTKKDGTTSDYGSYLEAKVS